MTLVNRLIKEAKASPPPRELVINASHVGTIIEHFIANQSPALHGCLSRDNVKALLYKGDIKLLDVPIRVVG